MSIEPEGALRQLVDNPAFPRSAEYDPRWVRDNMMGPNVLWLAESLSQVLELRPEHRILDLGCGRGLSSIFLAKEFGAQVWAADLWVKPWENWKRVLEAGVGDRVFPIRAEAHQLPFATEFFDVIVSLDAYHYFGTDAEYIGYITRFLKPGGRLGIVVPATTTDLEETPPHLAALWGWEFWTFRSPDWWRSHWARSGLVDVEHADLMRDGWQHWVQSDRGSGYDVQAPERAAAVVEDGGRTLGFSRVVARRTDIELGAPMWT